MTQKSVSRRSFVKKTSIAATIPFAHILPRSVRGANERIEVGVIGCGRRGTDALMKDFHRFDKDNNACITAVCDVWRQHREGAASMTREWYGEEAQQFEDYRAVLDLPNIDAIMIATPDHLHAPILTAAAKAGKDAYCEKPLAMDMKELNRVVDTVKEHGRIVQLGTQLRSWPSFTGCRKVVHDGTLGKIVNVAQVRNYYRPYWHGYARPIQESDTNWKLFLGHKRDRPFDPDQHSAWYGYRDFSAGPVSNLMCHYIDLVHYITGAQFPTSAVTMGGIYTWLDQRTNHDCVHTVLEYPEGFMVTYSTTSGNGSGSYTRVFGTKGMIDAANWREPFMTGEGTKDPERIKEKQQVPDVEMPHHMQNWIQCLRTREQPNANIDAGHQHAVACILAEEAMARQRKMTYSPKSRKIRPA